MPDLLFATHRQIAARPLRYVGLVGFAAVLPLLVWDAVWLSQPTGSPVHRAGSILLFLIGDAIVSAGLTADVAGRRLTRADWTRILPRSLLISVLLAGPVLALNLLAAAAMLPPALALLAYGLRFATGAGMQTAFGMTCAAMLDGNTVPGSIMLAWRATHGQRVTILLFVIAFFVLKLLAPFILVTLGLGWLVEQTAPAFQARISLLTHAVSQLVWSLLGAMLSLSMAILWRARTGFNPGPDRAYVP